MPTVSVRDAKASFSSLVEAAGNGAFVTITRHGKPIAALVSAEAADIARNAIARKRAGLVDYLTTIPETDFERARSPSRDVEL